MTSPALLSISEVAEHLGVSRWTVTRLLDSGDLESVPTPTGRRVSPVAFSDWIARQAVPATSKDGDMQTIPPLHNFDKIAETYGVSLRQLKDRARAREFEHTRIGSGWFFTDAQLTAFLTAHTKKATKPVDEFAGVRARLARRSPRKTPSQTSAA